MQTNVVKETGVETAGTLCCAKIEMQQKNLLKHKPQHDIPLTAAKNYV